MKKGTTPEDNHHHQKSPESSHLGEEGHTEESKKRTHGMDHEEVHKKQRGAKQLLSSTSMAEFMNWKAQDDNGQSNKPLIHVNSTESVRDAVQMLRDNNILSVPVWDDEEKSFIWFLSILDVLRFCMTDGLREDSSKAPYEFLLKDMIPALGEDEAGLVQTVYQHTNLSSVMEWFTLGVHRVLVQNAQGTTDKPSGSIVSQSDVVRFLLHHDKDLSADADRTLEEHGLLDADVPSIGPKKLITIDSSKTALEGFQMLFTARTSAVGVVDSDNKLLGNLSASDLRGVKSGEVEQLLSLPIADFLQSQSRVPLTTCSPSSTLRQVIRLLVENRIHRVWVVDAENHVVGLITLTDILCKFAPFDYKLLHSNKI